MSTLVHCPSCRANLRISPEKADRLLRCPKCKKNFRLRAANAVRSAPQAATKAAARMPAAPRPSAAPAALHRTLPPPEDDPNRTIVGQDLPGTVSTPPPLGPTLPLAPSSGKSSLLRWVLVGCLLTVFLVGGSIGAYYFWKSPPINSPNGPDGAQVNPAFGKWGVIEIGSKGIKPVVLDIFEADNKEGYDFRMPKWELKPNNQNLVAAAKDGQAFAPQALEETGEIVKQFHTRMREEYDVPPDRIYVMSSSGLWVPFARNPDLASKNQIALKERVKAAVGCELTVITARQEAVLGMKSCVPPKHWEESIYIDIGSGNVKGGCFESENNFAGMDLNFGSSTYTKRVETEAKRSKKPFAEQAADLRPTLLEQPLDEQIKRKAVLDARNRVDLAGGAVWALATFTHPNDSKPRVELEAANIERYAALVRKPKDEVRKEVLAQIENPEQRAKMEKEIARVQQTFSAENLQAGAEILQALSKVYRFRDKKLYFFRNSHIAWPMGYVLEKNKIRK
jgi:hypothetical protein